MAAVSIVTVDDIAAHFGVSVTDMDRICKCLSKCVSSCHHNGYSMYDIKQIRYVMKLCKPSLRSDE